MKAYKKVMDVLAMIEKIVLVLTSAVILILVFGNVLTRKIPFIKTSWSFTEELVIAIFVLISLLASALCCREDSNISLTLLTAKIKGRSAKGVKVLTTIICVLYCAVLTWQGWKYMMTQKEAGVHTFVLHWPEWIFCSFVPVAGVFMILHLIEYCLDFCTSDGNAAADIAAVSEAVSEKPEQAAAEEGKEA